MQMHRLCLRHYQVMQPKSLFLAPSYNHIDIFHNILCDARRRCRIRIAFPAADSCRNVSAPQQACGETSVASYAHFEQCNRRLGYSLRQLLRRDIRRLEVPYRRECERQKHSDILLYACCCPAFSRTYLESVFG